MKKFLVLALAVTVMMLGAGLYAAGVGSVVANVDVRDSVNNAAKIPDLGAKVLTVFYTDADAADLQDPLSDALKAKKYGDVIYRGQGIVNLKDSKAPNWLIRRIIKGKEQKYDTKILTDPDNILKTAWGLADCNNAAVVIVIGKDSKIKYINYLRKTIDAAEVAKVVALVDGLLGK
jgi:predicted transcriptional regulator